jgi:hypothetical protein
VEDVRVVAAAVHLRPEGDPVVPLGRVDPDPASDDRMVELVPDD